MTYELDVRKCMSLFEKAPESRIQGVILLTLTFERFGPEIVVEAFERLARGR